MHDEALLIARLFLGVPFVIWGTIKLRGGTATVAAGLKAQNVPDSTAMAWMIAVCETVGGLGVVLGYPVTTFGVLLGLWCLVTGYDAHRKDINQLLSHIAMAGGYFTLAIAGPGSIALFGGAPGGVFALLP